MSIQDGKVFLYISKRKNAFMVGVLLMTQVVLSVILSISLAGNIIWPEQGAAAAGSPMKIAYEGRLTDSSGNPLGGTGTVYCYRFSIYDSATAGSKLWPAGTPSDTTATTTDGIFNAVIGQTDTLTSTVFDFSTTSTAYLQVEVNTTTSTCGGSWEALLPRQQILASGYSLQSANVYGSLLKTDTVNNWVQIGAGGQANPIELVLDSNNATGDYVGSSCSVNGAMWYNTVTTQALICVNSTIESLGASGTTTIAAIQANGGTPTSNGTVVFSNSNGVTFGNNAGTITASVNAGAAGATYSSTVIGNDRGWAQGSVSLGQNSLYFVPHILQNPVSAIAVKMPVMVTNSSLGSSSGQVGYTAKFAIYTTNATNATVLSLHYSTSWTMALSNSSNVSRAASFITGIGNSTSYNTATSSSAGLNLSSIIHGPREVIMPISSLLTAGMYWFAFANSSSLAGTSNSVLAMSYIIASSQTVAKFGNATSATSGAGIAKDIGLGTYSATSGAFPGGVSLTQINKAGTNPVFYVVDASN